MDRERYAELRKAFAELSDAPRSRRDEELARLRAESPELAAQLERMLTHDERVGTSDRPASTRLEDVAAGIGCMASEALGDAEPPPARIASFAIHGVLGRGGMGTVYRAEQENPRRQVALKVLHPSGASTASLRRFELEAHALGRLQHPGIAQIYEAGTAQIGGRVQPFFAMELVDGEPITRFARRRALSPRARLKLLIKVAEAVHHAHQKGVIHRDLKPANVLVTGAGEPKVVDFGVARLVDRETGGRTLETEAGQVLGTLLYMSPEQVSGGGEVVDTRTDVYSLGAIAYELLSGRLPHDLAHATVPEAARRIAEEDPPPLGALDGTWRGDVETIVQKALEREPARRYASAREFAADLRRHLDDEPVEARPPSTAYQLRKFARRHRGLVAGLAVAMAILLAAAIGMSLLLARARRLATAEREQREAAEDARDAARENEAIALGVNRLLERLLTSFDPWRVDVPGQPDVRLVDALAWADAAIADSIAQLPAVEAAVRATLGSSYSNVGAFARARPHLERAHALHRELHGSDDPGTLRCLESLAALHLHEGAHEEAERLARECVTGMRKSLGATATETLEATGLLVHALRAQSRLGEALALAEEADAAATAALGADDPARLAALHNHGSMLIVMGRLREAEARLREASERRRAVFGEEHPLTLISFGNLGDALFRQGRHVEAEPICAATLAAYRRAVGDEHTSTLHAMHALSVVQANLGRREDAVALRRQQLEIADRRLGRGHPLAIGWHNSHAILLRSMGRAREAEACVRELIEVARSAAPAELPDPLHTLGILCNDDGRAAEALPLLEEAVGRLTDVLPERHWKTARYRVTLGECLGRLGRTTEAESHVIESVEDLAAALGVDHADTQYALGKADRFYASVGEPAKARALRQRIAE